MQPRGVFELKDSEQDEFRSDSAEDFAEGMKELHSRITEGLQYNNIYNNNNNNIRINGKYINSK